jgi:hypothetical protein
MDAETEGGIGFAGAEYRSSEYDEILSDTFVCKLKDGRFLVVEYKTENTWSSDDSKEKRALGELWSKRSSGACLFVMPKGLDFAAIERVLNA